MTCPLTRRELEVVQWASVGKVSEEIGEILGRAQSTICNRLADARLKAGVPNTTALVAKAIREEWIS